MAEKKTQAAPEAQAEAQEKPQDKPANADANAESSERHSDVPFGRGGAVERTGDPEAGLEEAHDFTDETANKRIFAADLGTSVTSFGDGESTLPPDMVTAREQEAERNANPDAENEAVARELGLPVDD